MRSQAVAKSGLSGAFQQVSEVANTCKRTAAPFSLRLTPDERATLEQRAAGRPLGAYIRERLLGEQAEQRQYIRKPKIDEKLIAPVLAALGASRLSSNLNQLAKSVNMGTLDASQDVEQELRDACAAVLAMRDALFAALGLKGSGL
ncbi:MAG: hypothetical protein L3J28_07225 [Candidatus Polarisedimenticolaceae bacterium]|nr:hypothetical protein [Candidatus Polarisedimenticolaceae bacterium]